MTRSAVIDGPYRYELRRTWRDEIFQGEHVDRDVCWIMLNPSTADADQDDPTIRRCIGFSKAWGYGGLVVVNLFALRATDPTDLWASDDPIGPKNDSATVHAVRGAGVVVCAWGNDGILRDRGRRVREMLLNSPWPPMALRLTATGEPGHPLYLNGQTVPFRLGPQEAKR